MVDETNSDWVPITAEETNRESNETWKISCPECGEKTLTPYGDASNAKLSCWKCGATARLGVKSID